MKPEPRQFTKDRPCSKVEIFACFAHRRRFRSRQVYEAEAELGRHVPRHMEQQGRLERRTEGDLEVYRLTEVGKEWLNSGIVRYLNNHPERIDEVWDKLPVWLKKLIRRPS